MKAGRAPQPFATLPTAATVDFFWVVRFGDNQRRWGYRYNSSGSDEACNGNACACLSDEHERLHSSWYAHTLSPDKEIRIYTYYIWINLFIYSSNNERIGQ